jgi:hypothetical protein
MAVTVTATRLDSNTVKVSAVSDLGGTPVLYWYDEGRLVSAGTFPLERIFTIPAGRSRQIEVLDTTDAPAEAYPGEVLLQWYAVADAVRYTVQQWVVDEWVDKRVVISTGVEVFNYLTDWLDDQTEYQFRVVPVSADNIEGQPLEFTFTVIRRPDAPDTECEYDAGTQRVTVSAAA